MLALGKVWVEDPLPFLHHGQQFGHLGIGATFQTRSELRGDPKYLKPFEQVVRRRQLPHVLEQFGNGWLFWQQML